MKKLLLFVAFIFATTVLCAQSITGTVAETRNGPPVTGLKVVCEWCGNSGWSPITTYETYTDSQGKFSFYPPEGNIVIYIVYPPYGRINFPGTVDRWTSKVLDIYINEIW